MRRTLILTISVLAGSVAAIGFFVASTQLRNPALPGPIPRDELDALVFESTVIFYAVIYLAGQGLYRWMGDTASAAIVQRQSEFHMAVFHFLAGMGLVALCLQAVLQGMADTAQVLAGLVGGALLATSLPVLGKRIRGERGTDDQGR